MKIPSARYKLDFKPTKVELLVGSVGEEKDVIRNYDELEEDYDESGRETGDGQRPTRTAVDRCLMGCPCQPSTRFVVALFASFGLLISFGLRCNIAVAVVQMTTNRTTTSADGTNKTVSP
ncbi:hypothetical protein LSAT2_001087 [Lamellibrachia satsuma]|nr:hypothetical protein LSAT2_001087 [Lamellibrachia satsuma]